MVTNDFCLFVAVCLEAIGEAKVEWMTSSDIQASDEEVFNYTTVLPIKGTYNCRLFGNFTTFKVYLIMLVFFFYIVSDRSLLVENAHIFCVIKKITNLDVMRIGWFVQFFLVMPSVYVKGLMVYGV